jgi:hypothetical protein
MTFKQVKIHPWKGDRYCERDFGVRLLLLGESHDERSPTLSSELTREVIREVIEEGDRGAYKFFRCVRELVEGPGSTPQKFWHKVAFYNYIQRLMGRGQRPTDRDLQEGEQPFVEVLEALRPDCVLVFSKTVWEGLPNDGWHDLKPPFDMTDRAIRGETGFYDLLDGHRIWVGMTPHPRWLGYRPDRWTSWVRRVLDLARSGSRRKLGLTALMNDDTDAHDTTL